ncbi:MAG: acylphosphatase [Actinomycetota bacterium]|nr:acylphosphatase [Actinomycetota bacterium]
MTGTSVDGDGTVRCHLLISGRVQGVFYRASLRDQATARGLGGWARNLADGRVEAEVEGPAAAVDEVVAWTHEGPPAARVTGVEVATRPPTGERTFTVRR